MNRSSDGATGRSCRAAGSAKPREAAPAGLRRPVFYVAAGLTLAGIAAFVFRHDIPGFAGVAAQWLKPGYMRDQLRALISRGGPWAPFVSVLLMVIHTFVPIPTELLAAANGAAFGMWAGSLITWIGTMLSAALGFGLARRLGRPAIERFVPRRRLARVDALIRQEGWWVALSIRFIPIPGDIISIALGLTRLPWVTYLWTTAVAIVPWTLASVAAGVGAVETRDILPWAIGGLALLNVAGLLVEPLIRRRLPRPP